MGVGLGGQGLQLLPSAHDDRDPAVIDDVIAVGGSRRGGEDRGEVEVGDSQIGQVGDQGLGVGEGEVLTQLETVGGHRSAVLRRGHVPRPGA